MFDTCRERSLPCAGSPYQAPADLLRRCTLVHTLAALEWTPADLMSW